MLFDYFNFVALHQSFLGTRQNKILCQVEMLALHEQWVVSIPGLSIYELNEERIDLVQPFASDNLMRWRLALIIIEKINNSYEFPKILPNVRFF